ncbi:MAG: hypothetical protein K8R31_11330 [Bacteroidales bacterium]|nr:hypothetical protein [Bacteroidales bacterium]
MRKILAIMYKTKYILILSLFLLLFACDNLNISSSQAETFVKLFGSWSTDTGNDVKEFNSGYLIITTMTPDNENTEIVLLQTNKFGNLINNGDTLSSIRGGDNIASKLLLTDDGGFIVIGTVEDTVTNIINEKNTNIYVEKFNSSITSEWEKFIGTNSNEEGVAIKKASSGYIIAGSTDAADPSISNQEGSKDIYLVKIDDAGNVEWTENHGGSGDEYSSDIITINNGYLVVGTTNGFHEPGQANNNIMLIKTNLSGGSPDMVTYGSGYNDYGAAIVKANDGGYVIVGSVEDAAGVNSDVYVVKVEEEIHNIIWTKVYGTTAFNDQGFDIIKSNGGFIIVGTKELPTGPAAYFLEIDGDGEILVENTYGGYGQTIYSIEPTSDGDYIMTGSSGVEGNEMICLIKANSEGEL